MPKADKNSNVARKKASAKTLSKPPAKAKARSESAASSSGTCSVGKVKLATSSSKREKEKEKEKQKAKEMKENARIRRKNAEMMLQEVQEEEAKTRSARNGASTSDDEENPDEPVNKIPMDSDEPGPASQVEGGEDTDEEKASEDDEDLELDFQSKGGESSDEGDGQGDGGADDVDMVVEEHAMPTSRSKRRSSGQSTSTFSKVTKDDFSPKYVRFAEAGRTAVRVAIATGDRGAFPVEHKEWTWDVLKDVAKREGDWEKILQEALDDVMMKLKLSGYSWQGAAQLRGELKKKALAILRAHYGIPGNNKAETMELVQWLLEKGRFKYGGLNTSTRTFDRNQPMGHPIFRDLIYQQWFSSGKSEGISQETASAFKDIPLPIIVLVMTAVENALMEYRQDGGRTQMNFSLEFMGPRYEHHMKCAKEIQVNSPRWLKTYQKEMYRKILEQTKFAHLLAEVDNAEVEEELDELDFGALEQTALQGV